MTNESSSSRFTTLLRAGVSAIMIAVAGMLFPAFRHTDHEDSTD